jgi:hypothetical protein
MTAKTNCQFNDGGFTGLHRTTLPSTVVLGKGGTNFVNYPD